MRQPRAARTRSGPTAIRRGWLLIAALACAAAAHAGPVAMIADLAGTQCRIAGASAKACAILDYLDPGATLRVSAGTQVSVVYFGSGREYAFTGPAEARIEAATPRTLSGAAPATRDLAVARETGLKAGDVQGYNQAALVLRGMVSARRKLHLIEPRNTHVIDTHPTFSWEPIKPGAQYRFVLSDQDGRIVLETLVNATRFELPGGVRLRENAPYTWQVETRLADGNTYRSAADFTLLDAAKRKVLEKVRPADGAPVAELVIYALALEHRDVRGEARRYWKLAAQRRPADAALQAKAGH